MLCAHAASAGSGSLRALPPTAIAARNIATSSERSTGSTKQ
jgi:hypothetical protein